MEIMDKFSISIFSILFVLDLYSFGVSGKFQHFLASCMILKSLILYVQFEMFISVILNNIRLCGDWISKIGISPVSSIANRKKKGVCLMIRLMFIYKREKSQKLVWFFDHFHFLLPV